MIIWDKIVECCAIAGATFDGAYGWFWDVLAICFIVLIFNFIFKRLLLMGEAYLRSRQKLWQQSFVSALYLPLSSFVWLFAAIEIFDLVISFKTISFLPNKRPFLALCLIVCFTWFLLRWKTNALQCAMVKGKLQKGNVAVTRLDVVDKLGTVAILVLGVMLGLEATGSSLNTLIAFGGVSGLAIAFASQEVIASFFGGLMIYLTHPFEIGDWIVLPEKSIEGNIEEIGWYNTKVRTFDKRPIYVPNALFVKMVVVNPSRMSHRQIKETIGIRYRDVNELKGVIEDIRQMLEGNKDIDQGLNYSAYFSSFGDYALNIVFTAYTYETSNSGFNRIKEELLFGIIAILDKHQAELAFPTTCLEVSSPNITAALT